MSSIEPYRGSITRRRAGRSISNVEAGTSVRIARLESVADVQAATADALTYVGRRALQDVALLSQIEQQLALTVPNASGRLAVIADITAVALSEVVSDTAVKLRRA